MITSARILVLSAFCILLLQRPLIASSWNHTEAWKSSWSMDKLFLEFNEKTQDSFEDDNLIISIIEILWRFEKESNGMVDDTVKKMLFLGSRKDVDVDLSFDSGEMRLVIKF